MATIALYANKINQMPGLVRDVKQSVIDYKTELPALKIRLYQLTAVYVIWMMSSVPYRPLRRHRKRKSLRWIHLFRTAKSYIGCCSD